MFIFKMFLQNLFFITLNTIRKLFKQSTLTTHDSNFFLKMMEIRFLKKNSLFTKNIEKNVFFQKKKLPPPPLPRQGKVCGRGEELTLTFGNEKNVTKHLYKCTSEDIILDISPFDSNFKTLGDIHV